MPHAAAVRPTKLLVYDQADPQFPGYALLLRHNVLFPILAIYGFLNQKPYFHIPSYADIMHNFETPLQYLYFWVEYHLPLYHRSIILPL